MDQLLVAGGNGASPSSAAVNDSDPHILNLVREGVTDAFDILYTRHVQIARYVARTQSDNPADADDVVSEAFATILQALKDGKGPKEFFRSYLLTVVRRHAHERNRQARLTQAAADDAILDSAVHDQDPVVGDLESSIMASAFKSLPERWQAVLFHLDIEGLKPAAVAPLVGLTPNGVSSLAIRAREGLRQAYLQHHISRSVDEACEEYASLLGKYARKALRRTSTEKVDAHLASCAKCTALLMELNDVQSGMRAILFPLVTGVAFTPAAVAAIESSAAALASSGTGTAAASGKISAMGLQGVSKVWMLTVGIVLGAVGLAGALVWFLQPNAGSHSTAVAEATSSFPPVQDTLSPGATVSAEPLPSMAATVAPTVVPPGSPPPTAETRPPAVVVPPDAPLQKSAVVIGSDAISSTTAPQATASAAPRTQTVTAAFAANQGSRPQERDLQIRFTLAGDGTTASGEAVFSLPADATFIEGRTSAPAGWECNASAAGQIRCTTASLDRNQLMFSLGVTMPANAEWGTLNYQFDGPGIVAKTFANTFQ